MNEGIESGPFQITPENFSGSPGAILRRCREFHEITLEEASETTKIGVSYLKSLENDQINEFANQAYLKGFLRIYVNYLGLNFDDISVMYEKYFGIQNEKTDAARTSARPSAPRRSFTWIKKMILPALLLAVILITATFFKTPPPPVVRVPQPPVVAAPLQQQAVVQTVLSSVQNKKTEVDVVPAKPERRPATPPVTEKNEPAEQALSAVKGFILKIRVTQNGTLTSNVDGAGAQQYELTIGDVIEWKADKSVVLELSNAGGVDVELNGKLYKPLGPVGKPAYVELNADGVKE